MKPCTARRRKPVTVFLGVLLNCLAVINSRQAMRAVELDFSLFFWGFGREWIEELEEEWYQGRLNLIVCVIQRNAWSDLMKQCNEMVRVRVLADW